MVQSWAGEDAGFCDKDYRDVGAEITSNYFKVFSESEMIVKVKEPLEEEISVFKENQIIFTYFHFAGDKKFIDNIRKKE